MKKITEKFEREFMSIADELCDNIISLISKKIGVEDILSSTLEIDTALREVFINLGDDKFGEEFVSSYAELYLNKIIGIMEMEEDVVDELLCNYTEGEFEKEITCFFLRRLMYNLTSRLIVPENWDFIMSCPILFEKMRLFLSQEIELLVEKEKV